MSVHAIRPTRADKAGQKGKYKMKTELNWDELNMINNMRIKKLVKYENLAEYVSKLPFRVNRLYVVNMLLGYNEYIDGKDMKNIEKLYIDNIID